MIIFLKEKNHLGEKSIFIFTFIIIKKNLIVETILILTAWTNKVCKFGSYSILFFGIRIWQANYNHDQLAFFCLDLDLNVEDTDSYLLQVSWNKTIK